MVNVTPSQVSRLKKLGFGSKPFYAKYKGVCYYSSLPIVPGDMVVYTVAKKIVHVAVLSMNFWYPWESLTSSTNQKMLLAQIKKMSAIQI